MCIQSRLIVVVKGFINIMYVSANVLRYLTKTLNFQRFKITNVELTKRRNQVDSNPASYTGGFVFIS